MSWRAPCRRYALFWHPQSPPIAHTVSTTHTRDIERRATTWPRQASAPCAHYTDVRSNPRTDARRRDVLALLRMAPVNNITALSLFSFYPRCFSRLVAVLGCRVFYLAQTIDFSMCVTAVIVVLQVNKLLRQLPGSQPSLLVSSVSQKSCLEV